MDVFDELNPPARLLLGPGPSPVHPRVMRALAAPVIGHLDPELIRLLDDTRGLLRQVFRTSTTWRSPSRARAWRAWSRCSEASWSPATASSCAPPASSASAWPSWRAAWASS